MPWQDSRRAEHAALLACDAATLGALGRGGRGIPPGQDARAASDASGAASETVAPLARSRYPDGRGGGRAREWAGLLATQEAETQALRQEVDLLRAQVRDAKAETAAAERRASEAE